MKRATSLPFHPLRIVKAGLVPAATLVKAGLVPAATFAHNNYNLGTSIQVHRDPPKLEFETRTAPREATSRSSYKVFFLPNL